MASGASESTRLDPLQYPWNPPKTSGLINGDDFLPLQPAAWRLNKALVEADAARLDSRFLVVSIGSNSSPDVMRRKFARYKQPVSRTLPLIRGQLSNIGIGHSAHVSRAGYIAAAPYFQMGARSTVWASWLDERQLMALEETEPNYRRIQLRGEACPLVMDNGECPETFSLFTSRWGILTDGNGENLPFSDQPALFRLLAGSNISEDLEDGRSFFQEPPQRIAEKLALPSAQAWAKEWFCAAGLATHVDLGIASEE
ncbi:hypothetical protein [Arthrobacter sp. ISL-28]|uniref:hypothetical protein n=1 Tax=Arthrobacter sp. ISL-28 TaxID=2819108 RepID=UPI001BEC2D86|nr:hypothetical protein [Arthrobacter sp. ISL-28]MBT2519834.1 hypothetical protein [Arthrobacter sp. ISL-28]